VMSTASNSSLQQSCSALSSVTSALEVIFNDKSTFYLLTYLVYTESKSSGSESESRKISIRIILESIAGFEYRLLQYITGLMLKPDNIYEI